MMDVNFFQISTIHNYNMVHMSLLHAIPCMSCMYHVIALIVTITMLCSVFQLAGPAGWAGPRGKYKPVL